MLPTLTTNRPLRPPIRKIVADPRKILRKRARAGKKHGRFERRFRIAIFYPKFLSEEVREIREIGATDKTKG